MMYFTDVLFCFTVISHSALSGQEILGVDASELIDDGEPTIVTLVLS